MRSSRAGRQHHISGNLPTAGVRAPQQGPPGGGCVRRCDGAGWVVGQGSRAGEAVGRTGTVSMQNGWDSQEHSRALLRIAVGNAIVTLL